ncbi:hypothetical protein C4552_00205 [Candidatus Parcubacteria bacterium]|nr:MAG: hypothetical protein C4552_00205 [Candidatus Parcubacteria bacterium]
MALRAFYLVRWLCATNNNRLKAMWIVTVVWFLWNCLIIGVGPSASEAPTQSFHYPHYRTPSPAPTHVLQSLWDIYGFWSWALWFPWLLATLVYTPIAFRDEVQNAFRRATQKFRERRGEAQQVRVVPQPGARHPVPQPAGGGGLTLAQYLTFEFITDFIQEIIAHRVFTR